MTGGLGEGFGCGFGCVSQHDVLCMPEEDTEFESKQILLHILILLLLLISTESRDVHQRWFQK